MVNIFQVFDMCVANAGKCGNNRLFDGKIEEIIQMDDCSFTGAEHR